MDARERLNKLRRLKELRMRSGNASPQPESASTPIEPSYGETALTVASSALTEPVAGIAGAATGLLTQDPQAGEHVINKIREWGTYQPRTESGQAGLQNVGEVLAPVGDALASSEQFLGEGVMDATGNAALAATAHSLPTLLLEGIGLKGLKSASKAAPRVAGAIHPELKSVEGITNAAKRGVREAIEPFDDLRPTKSKMVEQIKNDPNNVDTANFKIVERREENMPDILQPKPRAVRDKKAVVAVKQGFDPGVVAPVKRAAPATKKKLKAMIDITERSKKNKLVAMDYRASDIAGDSLMDRFRAVRGINRSAGAKLDSVAKSLKGKSVDFDPAVNQFLGDLQEMGVTFGDNMKPIFSGSDVEGLNGPMQTVTRMVKRMSQTKTPNAYDVHRLKKYIDEVVTYGKNADGLAGTVERTLKSLRHNLDEALDTQFPEYNKVNTDYAQSRGAMDALQDVAGAKMDLSGGNADKAVGTLMRRMMSNAQSRVRLMDAVSDIEKVAGQKVKFADDLKTQMLFADELDAVFGPTARTSFQGQIDQALKQGVNAAADPQRGVADMAIHAAGKGLDKVMGVNEEAAFKAIRDLLNEPSTL